MVALVLGIVVIALGIKGLSAAGIPLTRQKQLTGHWAKVAGVCCILFGILLLADGAWSLVSLSKQFAKTPAPQTPAVKTATLDPDRWTRFNAGYGNFSILMPGLPKGIDTGKDARFGKTEGRVFQLEDGDRLYQVVFTQFDAPAEDLAAEFDAARNSIVDASGGTKRAERDLTIGGSPAREIVIDAADGLVMRIAIILVDQTMYQLWAAGPKGLEDTELVNNYFNSFELTKPEPPADEEAVTPGDAEAPRP